MPERSFGRTVRYRRTKLGLSQAQLGELVGRSASTIRSWERDASVPSDESVLTALAAILDLDKQALFDKAGMATPQVETHPTLEEALASLAPLSLDAPYRGSESMREAPSEPHFVIDLPKVPMEDDLEPDLDLDSELEAEVSEHLGESPMQVKEREPNTVAEASSVVEQDPVSAATMKPLPEPAYVTPPEPFSITAPTPPVVEPSYLEDTQQRQLYRVRTLATIVLVVALGVVLLWALSNTVDALGTWWDDFFGTLRL